MTSQRWTTLVSGLVLTLALAAGSPARAQWGLPGAPDYPPVGQFGLGSGVVQGISPFGFGSFGVGGHVGSFNFVGFPTPGYARAIGQRPHTTTSFQSVSDTVTLVPGWSGSGHRVRRRH